MPTLTSHSLAIAKARLGFVDLTDDLRKAVEDAGIGSGCVVAYCRHTTCALIINEWEDGFFDDVRNWVERLCPKEGYYAHDDVSRRTQNLQENERRNGAAHVAMTMLGSTSAVVPVIGGEPMLGLWQRLILLELDEPKERTILFHVFGD